MVTLRLNGELQRRGYADVLCNGQPFCQMYMDKHGNTRLSPPSGLSTGLWDLLASFSPEAENHGDFPEDTLKKAEHDLTRIFAIVGAYQAPDAPSFVEVGLTFSVDGEVDQPLLDHLGQTVEMAVQRMYHEGIVTPNDDDERTITLENVTAQTGASNTAQPLPSLDPAGIYQREDDMNRGVLQVLPQEDGDICVTVVDNERECIASVEFCTPFSGGGRSPETLKALRQLAMAMASDSQ